VARLGLVLFQGTSSVRSFPFLVALSAAYCWKPLGACSTQGSFEDRILLLRKHPVITCSGDVGRGQIGVELMGKMGS
jgi:hypothetical protein